MSGPVNSDVFLMNADGSGRTDLSDYWNNDIP